MEFKCRFLILLPYRAINVNLGFGTLFLLIGWYGFMELIEILILGFGFGI